MKLQIQSIVADGRFASLLGERPASAALCDKPLLETDDWVVAPTLGAIVPNWLIVVPRVRALNYKVWQRVAVQNPALIVAKIGEHLGLSTEQMLWFEHGPSEIGTVVGCGVDYAHLHVLFDPAFAFDDLVNRTQASASLSWQSCSSDLVYSHLTGARSYLVLGNGNRAEFAEDVDATGSQFLRRMVCATAGLGDDWDYKHYPNDKNIALTAATFQACANGVARGG